MPIEHRYLEEYVDVIGGKRLQFTCKTCEKIADVRVRASWQIQEAVREGKVRLDVIDTLLNTSDIGTISAPCPRTAVTAPRSKSIWHVSMLTSSTTRSSDTGE